MAAEINRKWTREAQRARVMRLLKTGEGATEIARRVGCGIDLVYAVRASLTESERSGAKEYRKGLIEEGLARLAPLTTFTGYPALKVGDKVLVKFMGRLNPGVVIRTRPVHRVRLESGQECSVHRGALLLAKEEGL